MPAACSARKDAHFPGSGISQCALRAANDDPYFPHFLVKRRKCCTDSGRRTPRAHTPIQASACNLVNPSSPGGIHHSQLDRLDFGDGGEQREAWGVKREAEQTHVARSSEHEIHSDGVRSGAATSTAGWRQSLSTSLRTMSVGVPDPKAGAGMGCQDELIPTVNVHSDFGVTKALPKVPRAAANTNGARASTGNKPSTEAPKDQAVVAEGGGGGGGGSPANFSSGARLSNHNWLTGGGGTCLGNWREMRLDRASLLRNVFGIGPNQAFEPG